jgi:single-strand DNA-binding protein
LSRGLAAACAGHARRWSGRPRHRRSASESWRLNRRWQNRQTQEWEEATSFFDVVCWAGLAENVSESVTKGARLIVTGRLDQRSWENQEGEKRSKVEIVADEVGPSLRWASAVVTKNERRTGFDGGGGGGGGAAASAPPPSAPAGGYDYDEEPF